MKIARASPRSLICVPATRHKSRAAAVEERLTPIYPSTEGLGQARLCGVIERALQRLPADAELELIPQDLRKVYKLSALRAALLYVHRPPPDADLARLAAGAHPAQ